MASRVNTSFTLIPNQKYRRSNHRSSHFPNILDPDSQPLSTLGNFKALPLEIFQIILRCLSGRIVYRSFVFIGNARKLELRIRLFCRNVLLDHWTHRSDSAFWLTCILKPWPMVNQARLLYIIFGPVAPQDGEHSFLRDPSFCFNYHSGQVVWQKMIEEPADEPSLKGLADAIKLLYDTGTKGWTADDVISLVDELSAQTHAAAASHAHEFLMSQPRPETKECCISISSLLSPLTPQPTNHKAWEPVTKELLDFDQAAVKRLNFSPGTQSYPFVSKWSLNVMEVGGDLICIQVPKD
ncbi:hypothetical protein J1605_011010 [Eschrichtius robustus]|uniref:FBXO47 ARM repeats region domain-containing protein n=1 Tax=Eschrichtius robustus TaxID=9764 RepID=A0AB34GMD4_ESCRO|nr:hypothetical protein J1605_011010 [Eschrichtius robustus]